MIKLGCKARDKHTGLDGMPTHLQIAVNGNRLVFFQPRGLNPETGEPTEGFWIVEQRLEKAEVVADPPLPLSVLGTMVEDEASGFRGIATDLVLHISGCIHVTVQPRGELKKTGGRIKSVDFDIRRLKGEAIPKMTESERERDQKRRPSPSPVGHYEP